MENNKLMDEIWKISYDTWTNDISELVAAPKLYQSHVDVACGLLNWYDDISNTTYDNIMNERPFGMDADEYLFQYYINHIYNKTP